MSSKFEAIVDNFVVVFIEWIERLTLIVIALLTVGAIYTEINVVIDKTEVHLADLLLLFIYSEILLMVSIFYSSKEIPLAYPIFIAITALARLIILQGKEMDPQNILFEAVAIAVLASSVWILGKSKKTILSVFNHEEGKIRDDK